MVTDRPPRARAAREQFEASDALGEIDAPPGEALCAASNALRDALAADDRAAVQRAGDGLLALLAEFYGVETPALKILGSRPHNTFEDGGSWELFGDYDFETKRIRAWMRTAVLDKVTSHRGLLNTLLHEFCHHLDRERLGFDDTPHTRGFYARVDVLYHLALATPPEKRKPLVWIRMGRAWRVDWKKLRSS